MLARLGLVLLAASLTAVPASAKRSLVHDQAEYLRVAAKVSAGDTIVLADGVWRNFGLVISGSGEAGKPITVTAQHKGRVFLTGQSSLRIGGAHIVVSGLVFRDGYSPRGEVISFRRNATDVARFSRVTEVVVDGFSKPNRYDDDYWVALYGQHNRFDHNDLIGKTNKGVTLAVRLDTPASRNNQHRIDHNYFGPRQVLGSNGGESVRIGTSTYSMYTSGTTVEDNVFDRCYGEVEIISSKSGGNIYRRNLFLDSRGTLTLRHGDGNLVERNVFLGHGQDYTGGIRVINRDQIVRDNYMEGLRGTGFASALTVMKGVPNSPVNRYVQVDRALIEHNTVVDSAQVALGAGASAERTASPVNSRMVANLFAGVAEEPLFRIASDISGIAFVDDVVDAATATSKPDNVAARHLDLKRAANGLLYPTDRSLADIGAPRDLTVPQRDQVGASWYPKPVAGESFGVTGRVTRVESGEDTLFAAVAAAKSGDVLDLQPGKYIVNEAIPLSKTITIRGPSAAKAVRPVVLLARPALIELEEGGNLRIENLVVDGSLAPDSTGSSVIRTGASPIKSNMAIEMSGVTFRNLAVNSSFNVLTLGKSALADHVTIRNCRFENITGVVVSAAAEREDLGQYDVEYLDITGNQFENIGGPIAAIYRGGTDESTFGPSVTIRGNTLTNVGHKTAAGFSGAIYLLGVQTALLENNILDRSGLVRIIQTVGTPVTRLTDNRFVNTPAPIVEERNFAGPPRFESRGNTVDGKAL